MQQCFCESWRTSNDANSFDVLKHLCVELDAELRGVLDEIGDPTRSFVKLCASTFSDTGKVSFQQFIVTE